MNNPKSTQRVKCLICERETFTADNIQIIEVKGKNEAVHLTCLRNAAKFIEQITGYVIEVTL